MRIKSWLGCVALSLAFVPSWVGAGVAKPLDFCVTHSSPLDKLNPDLAPTNCGEATLARISTTRNSPDRAYWPASNALHTAVNRAVIVILPAVIGPTPPEFDAMDAAILSEERNSIWLVALRFSSSAPSPVLQWPSSGTDSEYLLGNKTNSPANVEVSSFEVVDFLVRKLKAWAPNLEHIAIVGFGPNAEFVNRYSIATRIDDPTSSTRVQGVSVRYLMASADRYTYLTPRRFDSPVDASGNPVENQIQPITDTSINNCSADPGFPYYYDKYPYGVGELLPNHYVSGTPAQLKNRVKRKPRLFLVGSGDSGASTDSSCAALEQGPNRRNRAIVYAHHMRSDDFAEKAGLCVIRDANNQDIGYDPTKMLGSHAAMYYWKFGTINCALNDPVDCVPEVVAIEPEVEVDCKPASASRGAARR